MTVKEELEGWKRIIDTAAFNWLRHRQRFDDIEYQAPGPGKKTICRRYLGIPVDIVWWEE